MSYSRSAWDNQYYHQYMQHHAQLTQWFEQLQQTIDPNRGAYPCNGTHARPFHRDHTMQHCRASPPCCNSRGRPAIRVPQHCCSVQAGPTCYAARPCGPSVQRPQQYARAGALLLHNSQNNVPTRGGWPNMNPRGVHIPPPRGVLNLPPRDSWNWFRYMSDPNAGPAPRRTASRQAVPRQTAPSQAFVEKQEESDDSMEEEDNSSSEDELVCDLDAFVSVLESEDDSDNSSEESFDLVDLTENDNFKKEYVELDEYGITQKRIGKRGEINTLEKELLKKEQREYLYGDSADAICGLETVMAINFDHFIDLNQPVLWPVLPLCL